MDISLIINIIESNISINYESIKESLIELNDTNMPRISVRDRIYDNIFLYEGRYDRAAVTGERDDYFYLLDSMYTDCLNGDTFDLPNEYKNVLMSNSGSSRYADISLTPKILVENINIKETFKDNAILLDIIDRLENSCNDRSDLPSMRAFTGKNNLLETLKIPLAIKYMLLVKFIILYVNPNIDKEKLSDENIGYISLLDLDETITDDDKKIVLNLIKLNTLYDTYSNYTQQLYWNGPTYIDFYNHPYFDENKNTLHRVIVRINNKINIIKKLFISLGIKSLKYTISSLLIGTIYSNIQLTDYRRLTFLNDIYNSLSNKHINKKKYFRDIIATSEIGISFANQDGEELENTLDKLKKFVSPIIYDINYNDVRLNTGIDDFFSKISGNYKNIFSKYIETDNLIKKNELLYNIFDIDDDKLRLSLRNFDSVINIDTNSDVSYGELFNKDDSELKYDKETGEYDKETEEYKKILNITKQFFDKGVITPDIVPYFRERYISTSGVGGAEKGYTTGPTKDIMYNLSRLMNYIIRYDKDTRVKYTTPIWAKNNSKIFYTFLTHYILRDLSLETSKFDFYLNFKMIVPCMITLLKKENNNRNSNNLSIINNIIIYFNNFVGINDIKKLLFDNDNLKYDIQDDDYVFYYNSIALFLIGDLLEGGSEYKILKDYPEYILDPDNDYLKTQIEIFKPPQGFFDYESLDLFYSNSRVNINATIEKTLFKFYAIIKNKKKITSKSIIDAIIFINQTGVTEYNIIETYIKKLIKDYTQDLPENVINNIKEVYPNQEDFNNKLLLVWTANRNINNQTTLTLEISSGNDIIFTTCHNYMLYPVNLDRYQEISYEDFVISILGVMTGSGFGRGGKKKKSRNNKNKIINKKTKKQLVKKVKENSKIKKDKKIILLKTKKNNKKHKIKTIKKR